VIATECEVLESRRKSSPLVTPDRQCCV
jgi:hypothetical protein